MIYIIGSTREGARPRGFESISLTFKVDAAGRKQLHELLIKAAEHTFDTALATQLEMIADDLME